MLDRRLVVRFRVCGLNGVMVWVPEQTRVVITGVGTVAPNGIGNAAFWESLQAGRSAIGLLESMPSAGYPSKLAAEIRDFYPEEHIYCRKFIKVMSRDIQLGVTAASMAMHDGSIKSGDIDPTRLGVVYGGGRISSRPEDLVDAASQSLPDDMVEFTRWGEDGLGKIAPLWLLKRLPNMPACHVAIEHDAQGPNNTITCRDASALLALGEAVRVIERGAADAMIVGACSSNIHPVDLTKFNLFESLSHRFMRRSLALEPAATDRVTRTGPTGEASHVRYRQRCGGRISNPTRSATSTLTVRAHSEMTLSKREATTGDSATRPGGFR